MTPRRRVIGVDFSGARDAGRRIWIAEGRIDRGRVRVDACFRASELPGGSRERDAAHAALVAYVGRQTDAIVGLDLPFSLPRAVLSELSWIEFVAGFPGRFPSPETFRTETVAASGGRELKRRTDIETRAPFSGVNMRMFRQTHYGIGAVLAPIVAADAARAVPLQEPHAKKPILVEICPASLLKSIRLYPSYKGRSKDHRKERRSIVAGILERNLIAPLPAPIAATLVDDTGGDALDAVLAAVCAANASRHDPSPIDALEAIEGRVYF